MANNPSSELLGSNDAAVTLGSGAVESEISISPGPLKAYAASYTRNAMAVETPGEPDRLFLKLRNIRGNQGACIFDVAVSIPGRASEPMQVGSLALFGLKNASDARQKHGGSGLTKTIEITDATDPYLPELKEAGRLIVNITPRGRLRPGDKITIEKIGLYKLSDR